MISSSIQRKPLPSYRIHKPSGQAVVTLSGRDFYLGEHGSAESRSKYDQKIAEWLANGRRLIVSEDNQHDFSINELILAYWRHAESYYVKNGKPTSEQSNVRSALKPLRKLYGHSQTAEFSPLCLKAVRDQYLKQGVSRSTVNRYCAQVKRMFKWAVENELVPVNVWHGLQAVSGLKKGRVDAPESEPVRPVSPSMIEAIQPFVAPQVWAMVQLQLLTAMRPGEVVQMRMCDVDQTGDQWLYTPETHKNVHRDKVREVVLGPKAREILNRWVRDTPDEYLFSPREAADYQLKKRSTSGRSQQSSNSSKRPPGSAYTTASYRRAIHRGCEQAFGMPAELRSIGRNLKKYPEAERILLRPDYEQRANEWRAEYCWSPNQLRHNAATEIRQIYGIEEARCILGHTSSMTTEIYAEADRTLGRQIMQEIG